MKADGTGTTAHHVLVIENEAKTESVSFTCNELSGEATSESKTATELTFENLSYSSCKVNGSPGVTVAMNGCKYRYAAGGTLAIAGCNAGKKIEWIMPGGSGCIFTVGEQTLTGAGYHNVGEEAKNTAEITAELKLQPAAVASQGNCSELINTGQTLIGTYTTGNTLLTGESSAVVMANLWWK
jgi:hypothetical protein